MIAKFIDKYRQEAIREFNGDYRGQGPWRRAILEAIFRPKIVIPGKGPMTHLHPDSAKLHLPHGVHIADWRKYKVEDHPVLVNFQKRCHAAGLHDPWLRNYAFALYPNHVVYRSRFAFVTNGCLFGLVLGASLYAFKRVFNHYFPPSYYHTKEYIEKYGNVEIGH